MEDQSDFNLLGKSISIARKELQVRSVTLDSHFSGRISSWASRTSDPLAHQSAPLGEHRAKKGFLQTMPDR